MNRQFRQRLLTSTLLVGASLIAAPAFAQNAPDPSATTPSPPDNAATPETPETTTPVEGMTTVPSTSATGETVETDQDIVVTGSRIPQPNLTSASPVTVVTAQEVKLQGTTRTEDLINSLPQSFAAQGSNISNGATGAATVNLRGLGTSRTLVLVNGRRLQPGDPRDPVADINFIPAPLIKRVDVLTGGASSVYGADAVAGVVNFIMDTNFRGLRIDAQASAFMHNNDANDDVILANEARGFRPPRGTSVNGGAQDLAVVFGAGFDDNRGNITAYATYRKQRPVLQSTRDYSFCALAANSVTATSTLGRSFSCGGSGTSAGGTFLTNVGNFTVGPNQTFVTSNATTNPPFNFAPYNYYQRPDERYTLGAFAEYEISEGAKPYLEAMFMDDRSVAQIAPSGNFFATTNVNCNNPLLSAQQIATVCVPANTFVDGSGVTRAVFYPGRRNVEGGGRQDDLQHTAYRLVGGVRGDFLRGLSYDTYYQYGVTNLAQTYLNDFSIQRLGRALDVIDNPAIAGIQPVCRSVVDGTDPNCVPYNIFVTGGVTQDALDYLQTPGFLRGDIRESIANANLTFQGGEYGMQLPWANRGLGINFGGEYRKESLNFDTDVAFSTGDLAGQGGPTIGVEGSFDVKELFAEVDIPIVNESFIHEFALQAGYRYSTYDVGENNFNTSTYKISAELAPVQDVRFRGSYNRAVRAPNIIELFSAQAIQLDGSDDPCDGVIDADPTTESPTATLAQCQALGGVTAAQFGNINVNPANQFNVLAGGNPNLAPEKADSITLGVVVQPRFIPGLAVTVDYFKIKVENQIGSTSFDAVIGDCLEGDAFACSLINRNPQGSLFLTGGFIEATNQNFPGVGLQTKGVDIQASYARQIGRMGNLNLSLVGTRLQELGSGGQDDCVGYYGGACGTPNPKWRHKFRAGFTLPNGLGLSGQWRYFSAVDCFSVPEGSGNCALPSNARLQAQSYFDLALSARITNRYNFRVGSNNIFDREPPLAGQTIGAGSGNGNTYPQVYDSLGRYFFAGVTLDF